VALNPTDEPQTPNLTFRNRNSLAPLTAYRTSASENLQRIDAINVRNNKATFAPTPQSIVTFSGKIR
jgi:hypothetical protein